MAGLSAGEADPATLKRAIVTLALDNGFDAVGVAPAALSGAARAGLEGYLRAGYHGDMGWLAARVDERASPHALWPEAKSVIVLGANYAPEGDPLAALDQPTSGNLSVYARGADYHDVLKRAVKRMARALVEGHGGAVKVFVDTAPVLEKPLAQAAGLGWQGKHTNLVSREFGSWLFLAELFTTLDLPPDDTIEDHCGSCQRCLDVCPTKAFPAPHQLDARRCISYLTIEHKGHIAPEFRAAIGNRIYGCDDCLAVCPWNKFAKASRAAHFQPRPGLEAPALAALIRLDDPAFRRFFTGSPIKRIGRDRFVRNVLIAIGNAKDPSLVGLVEQRLDDTSPLVRAMAVWALARLVEPERFAALKVAHGEHDADSDVRQEWAAPFRLTGP
ncbi:MAG: tRNA epoxyqueuosine(34) reductase QueG [Alphaproteobacteria bacterium]|nr:tRNA epoxyqueuosine(34) reductase QueG [Alphaproteobacteria bacterium]